MQINTDNMKIKSEITADRSVKLTVSVAAVELDKYDYKAICGYDLATLLCEYEHRSGIDPMPHLIAAVDRIRLGV